MSIEPEDWSQEVEFEPQQPIWDEEFELDAYVNPTADDEWPLTGEHESLHPADLEDHGFGGVVNQEDGAWADQEHPVSSGGAATGQPAPAFLAGPHGVDQGQDPPGAHQPAQPASPSLAAPDPAGGPPQQQSVGSPAPAAPAYPAGPAPRPPAGAAAPPARQSMPPAAAHPAGRAPQQRPAPSPAPAAPALRPPAPASLPVPGSSPPSYASPPPAWSWRPSTELDVLLVMGSATAIGVILLVIWITTTVAGRIAWS